MHILRLNRAGDTIVEVLISIAVLGLVLGFAYNLALVSGRDVEIAQEHSQAVQLAQGQIEYLRQYYQDGKSISQTGCFDSSSPTTFTTTLSNCTTSNLPGGKFSVSPPSSNIFTITVQWNAPGMSTPYSVIMYYQIG